MRSSLTASHGAESTGPTYLEGSVGGRSAALSCASASMTLAAGDRRRGTLGGHRRGPASIAARLQVLGRHAPAEQDALTDAAAGLLDHGAAAPASAMPSAITSRPSRWPSRTTTSTSGGRARPARGCRLGDQALVDLQDVHRQPVAAGPATSSPAPKSSSAIRTPVARSSASRRDQLVHVGGDRVLGDLQHQPLRRHAVRRAARSATWSGVRARRAARAGETFTDTQTSWPSASHRDELLAGPVAAPRRPAAAIRPHSSATGMNSSGARPGPARGGASAAAPRRRPAAPTAARPPAGTPGAARRGRSRRAARAPAVVRRRSRPSYAGVVPLDPALAALLGRAQREVGVAQQLAPASARRGAGQADAGRRGRPAAAGRLVRPASTAEQPLGDAIGRVGGRPTSAPRTRRRRAGPPRRRGAGCARSRRPTSASTSSPTSWPAHVVDVLEAVEVDREQHAAGRARRRASRSARSRPRRLASPVSGSVCASSRKCASRSASCGGVPLDVVERQVLPAHQREARDAAGDDAPTASNWPSWARW